ncbi:hypothetical protein ERJ75_000497200 [Trypanosoma vivax]|nr:hypothetical protein ERJ75_000561400 [Trypanosoma vivax]KAH8616270.1 hypothetical protein ERJ75_000497200 [Trypanosoma vivax]
MTEERQIQSMVDFIEREDKAQEKADELNSAAQEEYDVEKMRLVEAEKVKARAAGEKKLSRWTLTGVPLVATSRRYSGFASWRSSPK